MAALPKITQAIMSVPLGTNKDYETMAGKIRYKMAKIAKNREERIAHLKEAVIRYVSWIKLFTMKVRCSLEGIHKLPFSAR